MRRESEHILELVERYLNRQRDIYGDELMIKSPSHRSEPGVREVCDHALESFYHEIESCQKCALARTRLHFVFGAGNDRARLMLVGEAPGADEDRLGEPFVGRAGQLLNKMLEAINFRRDEVYIANILKCRPPGNRDPLPDEIALCKPYLHRQIELIEPDFIIALGRIAAQALLGTTQPLASLRGKIHPFAKAKLIVTYHPAALLRFPQYKAKAWEDLQLLKKLYDDMHYS